MTVNSANVWDNSITDYIRKNGSGTTDATYKDNCYLTLMTITADKGSGTMTDILNRMIQSQPEIKEKTVAKNLKRFEKQGLAIIIGSEGIKREVWEDRLIPFWDGHIKNGCELIDKTIDVFKNYWVATPPFPRRIEVIKK